MTRLTVGERRLEQFGDWNVRVGYKYLQSDATIAAFTDSDFGLGGTNLKGYIVGGSFAFSHSVSTTVRWLSASSIAGPPYAVDVLQVDLNTLGSDRVIRAICHRPGCCRGTRLDGRSRRNRNRSPARGAAQCDRAIASAGRSADGDASKARRSRSGESQSEASGRTPRKARAAQAGRRTIVKRSRISTRDWTSEIRHSKSGRAPTRRPRLSRAPRMRSAPSSSRSRKPARRTTRSPRQRMLC